MQARADRLGGLSRALAARMALPPAGARRGTALKFRPPDGFVNEIGAVTDSPEVATSFKGTAGCSSRPPRLCVREDGVTRDRAVARERPGDAPGRQPDAGRVVRAVDRGPERGRGTRTPSGAGQRQREVDG